LEGDFDRPQPPEIGPGERPQVKKLRDNLRPEEVQRSTREYNGVVEFSSVGSQNSSSGVSNRKKMAVYQ
jgi:hypothetical protein